jgi:prevent-host-death family protein
MLEKPKTRMVNMTYAKTNLSKLVKAAENDENIVITRDGKPVVRLAKLEEQVQAKGWSKKMLAHFAKVLAKPIAELEPDPFPKSQELDDFRDPFAELEPVK